LKSICFKRKCSECGKKLRLLGGYRHPVQGEKECVCSECWNKIEESESKYSKFILNSIQEGSNGTICYILISALPTYEKKILNNLSKIPEVVDLYPLLGWYDIIVKIEAKDYVNLGNFILNRIRSIEGIDDTRTLTGPFSLVEQ